MRLNWKDPTVQRCSHRLHSAASLERRSHCPVAPAEPLLFVIGTVEGGHYFYTIYFSIAKEIESNEESKVYQGKAGEAGGG